MSDDDGAIPTEAMVKLHTKEELAARRQRRRATEEKIARARRGARDDGHPIDIQALGDPRIDDPPAYLEGLRYNLIRSMIIDASETSDRELRAKICAQLLKFTSMGRTASAPTAPRDELPDLSQFLTEAQLATLASAPEDTLSDLAQQLSARQSAMPEPGNV